MSRRLVALGGLFLLVGCGYTTLTHTPGGIRSVAVETFRNETYEHGLELEVTDALVRELVFDGRVEVRSPEAADAVLTGSVIRYTRSPYAYEREDRDVREYRVSVWVEATLTDRRTGRPLWVGPGGEAASLTFKGDASYAAYSAEGGLAEARALALQDLAKRIAHEVVEAW